eukprot:scaffold10329_cov66-Cyclotella_meneghiniana.AAC.4
MPPLDSCSPCAHQFSPPLRLLPVALLQSSRQPVPQSRRLGPDRVGTRMVDPGDCPQESGSPALDIACRDIRSGIALRLAIRGR